LLGGTYFPPAVDPPEVGAKNGKKTKMELKNIVGFKILSNTGNVLVFQVVV
jgi:hypothetical protein